MPEQKHRYLESGLLKVLGLLVLCISGIVISISLLTWQSPRDSLHGSLRFQQNRELSQQLDAENQDIFRLYFGKKSIELDTLGQYYTAENTNVRLRVEMWKKDRTSPSMLVNTFHDDAYSNTSVQYYGFDKDGVGLYYGTDIEQAENDLKSGAVPAVYGIRLWLLEPLSVHDGYYEQVRYLQFSAAIQSYRPACILIGSFVFLIALTYELYAAGHRKDCEGIVLAGIDQIPLDISLVFLLIVEWGILMVCESFLGSYSTFSINGIIGIVGTLLLMALVFYFWLMSLARRVKAHTWIENNITTSLFKWLSVLLSGIHEKRMITLLAAAYFLYQILLINRAGFSSFHTSVLILITIGICLYGLRQLGMQETINKAIHALKSGDAEYRIPEKTVRSMRGSMRETALDVNALSVGMKTAVEKQMKSERLKTKLITNVGHDFKTPLTSIISYVDLLDKLPSSEEQARYIEVLKRQTERLKKLSEDVLEASKASSGNVEMHIESVSLSEVVEQSLAEYTEKMEAAHLEVRVNVAVANVYADGRLLWRVLRNLLSNMTKYSMPNSRIYIDASELNDSMILLTLKNTSKDPLNVSSAELMERFVRGDTARHTEGSGLGLNIAQSLIELMHGKFELRIDGDLFKVMILLPKAAENKAALTEQSA